MLLLKCQLASDMGCIRTNNEDMILSMEDFIVTKHTNRSLNSFLRLDLRLL